MTESVQQHLTELQLSMLADDAVPEADATAYQRHLDACSSCRTQLAELADEANLFRSSLQLEAPIDVSAGVDIPKFTPPTSLTKFALANIATGLVIWLAQFLWKTIFGELVMNGASWLTSIYVPDIYELASTTALYYLEEGTAMLDAYLGLVIASLLAFTLLWLLLLHRRQRDLLSLCALLALGGSLAIPVPVQALEIRRDEAVVTVAADEVVNDTLLIAAETVLVKGEIKGDLIAVGRRVDIEGSVSGNLISFAQTVTVRGKVGGFVTSAASKLELSGAAVGGDFWGAGESVTLESDSSVGGNASVAGQSAIIEGSVGKDLNSFAEILEVSGALGADLEAFGNRVRLLDGATIAGDARLRVKDQERLLQEDSAVINGELQLLELPEEFDEGSRYSQGEYYLWQLARLVSAVLVGVVLLWLAPSLRSETVKSGIEGVKTAGFGLLGLIGIPLVAVLVAVTLIGIPFSVMAVMAWVVVLYLAKIVVGIFVGRMLLANTQYADNNWLVVLAGMTVIILAINIPVLGEILNFILLIVGIGMILERLLRAYRAQSMPAAA